MKVLVLKLGSQCNWNCPHCHNETVNYPYNRKIIDFIRKEGYDRITFSGGEPLLYWNTIVKICTELGHDYKYRFVTNGSLLDRSKLAFLYDYGFEVILSFDGSDGNRTNDPPPNYRYFSFLPNTSFSVCVYEKNMDLAKIQRELAEICKEYKIRPKLSLQPEFIHQTEAVDSDTTIETAKEYCRQISQIIESEIVSVVNVPDQFKMQRFRQYHTLKKALVKWFIPKKKTIGLRCFNENTHVMTLDGKFLLCPYNPRHQLGNIDDGIDWEKLKEYRPEKCRKCEIFDICRCTCVENKTENECYIARTMNRWMNKVADKYKCRELLINLWNEAYGNPVPSSPIHIVKSK